jgi:hypothetical protein
MCIKWKARVYKDKVPKRIFRAEREKVTGGWRELQNQKDNNLFCSPDIIRAMKSSTMR